MSIGFVDLHSHVLPGLDDGARTAADSGELVRLLRQLGFEVVCATPHQKSGAFMPTREAIDAAHAALAEVARPLGLELRLGAENFWDEVLLGRIPGRAFPTYTGAKAFLFEIHPRFAPPRLEEQLFQLRVGGLLPVMAHPERYQPLWVGRDLPRYQALGRTAALVVDLGAIDGAHGASERTYARRLVEEGLAHAVASDVHSPSDVRSAAAGMAWIRKRLGEPALHRLLADNPRRILSGELPESPES